MSLSAKYGVSGFFRLVVKKSKTNETVKDTGFFKNVITNFGMNSLGGQNNSFQGCTVGSGSSPELPTDTVIQSLVARATTYAPSGSPSNISGVDAGKYYAACRATWRFAEGAAAGNLTEVGVIADNSAPNYYLFSRTLIKDEYGSPITITVLPDEILDVYYEGRIYLQDIATEGSVVVGAGSYAFKALSGQMTASSAANIFTRGFPNRGDSYALAYDGPLGLPPANNPSGELTGASNRPVSSAYVQDSFKCSTTYVFVPGNATGSHRSYRMDITIGPTYVIEITPAYVKSETTELKLTHSVTWARMP